MLTSAGIKARAIELGFDLCGIAPAAGFPELAFLRQWIDRGYAGEMGYMARTAHRRADVRCVLPSARAVVALATVVQRRATLFHGSDGLERGSGLALRLG